MIHYAADPESRDKQIWLLSEPFFAYAFTMSPSGQTMDYNPSVVVIRSSTQARNYRQLRCSTNLIRNHSWSGVAGPSEGQQTLDCSRGNTVQEFAGYS